jgi:hypothetical protein
MTALKTYGRSRLSEAVRVLWRSINSSSFLGTAGTISARSATSHSVSAGGTRASQERTAWRFILRVNSIQVFDYLSLVLFLPAASYVPGFLRHSFSPGSGCTLDFQGRRR